MVTLSKTKEIDPDQRDWMYDGNGNRVYKNNYTKVWESDMGVDLESKALMIAGLLKENIAEVVFTKVDGTSRTMRCTLMEKFLPAQKDIEQYTIRKSSIAVWDLDKEAWRSFRIDSVNTITVV
jgi:hypothetical protein